jgi:AcrR family transcriptional regulator
MPTRRDRLRAQTLEEISAHAWAQVDASGAATLSSNAIAKAMGMSGPAMYRYFASRDALLEALVVEAYTALVTAMAAADEASARKAPAKRIAAVCAAYRAWALAYPRRYAMLFEPRPGDVADTEEAIGEIHAGMVLLLGLLGEVAGEHASAVPPTPAHSGKLERQLARWAARSSTPIDLPPPVLGLGVLTWTRLHGIVSLEVAGVFADMQLDAGLLLDAELDAVLAALPG